MRVFSRLIAVALLIGAGLSASGARSHSLPESERLLIEALITHLERLGNATFVRNGKAYPPQTAGKFLRAKWKDRAETVRSAEDFIERIGARSSTTGRAYLVRFSDGRETPTGTLLHQELRRLRAKR